MNRYAISLALASTLAVNPMANSDTQSYLEVASVMRQHNYDLDIAQGGARYVIDERFRNGWSLEGGWMFAPTWTLLADYRTFDSDNADGIILASFGRIQAPINYSHKRMSLGIQKDWQLTDKLWLDTSVRYQRTKQGIDDFYIESRGFAFGLNTTESDYDAAAEIALRRVRGKWEFALQVGYDPHAGFELDASSSVVESSFYGGLRVDYHIGDHIRLGLETQAGKVTDFAFTVGVLF